MELSALKERNIHKNFHENWPTDEKYEMGYTQTYNMVAYALRITQNTNTLFEQD
jgi:hypothetical protein